MSGGVSIFPGYLTAAGQTRWVDKSGSDTTGNGSFGSPYATIQKALDSITDAASAKPYRIVVGVGTFTEAFLVKPWTFIVGSGRNLTTLSPVQANWISSGFSSAGSQDAGISQVTIGATFLVDFNAVASPGAGRFFLYEVQSAGVAISCKGNNSSNAFISQDVQQASTTAGITHTFTDVPVMIGDWLCRSNSITITNSGAYAQISRVGSVFLHSPAVFTVSGGTQTTAINSVFFSDAMPADIDLVLVGDAVTVIGTGLTYQLTVPDGNQAFTNQGNQAGANAVIGAGLNLLLCNPTTDVTYTFHTPTNGTRYILKNQSDKFITISPTSAAPGGATYIGPFAWAEIFCPSNANWSIQNSPQSGTATLTNGVSGFIAADVTAKTVIVATLKTVNGAAGTPYVKDTDRNIGAKASGGGFKIHAINLATGADVATDQGTYDWICLRP